MNSGELLTIAIPTYNRPKKLVTTLDALLLDCPDNVRILVVDNASDILIEQYVRESSPEILKKVSFHRNRANVGLVANICRCYELVETPWVWTVGDDDSPPLGAIQKVLEEIRYLQNRDSLLGINFSTSIFTYPKSLILHNLREYWEIHKEPMAFSNALFLASCVFRTDNVLKYLRIGYQQTFSAASHIAIPVAGLNDGMQMAISPSFVMKLVPPSSGEGWNWVSVFSGIPILAEATGDAVTIGGIAKPLAHFAPGLRIKSGLGLILLETSRTPNYWYIYYSRLVPCLQGKKRLIALLFRFISGTLARRSAFRNILVRIGRLAGLQCQDSTKGNSRL